MAGERGKRRWRLFRAPGVDLASRVGKEGLEGAREGLAHLRPRRFDRRGFFGRDLDGGIERFRDHAHTLTEDEIEGALFAWERDRGVFVVVCAGMLAAIPLAALYGILSISFAIGLVAGAALMGVKAAVADFRAWQIQQGRFGAPVEYLNHRLPRNMHIIDRERS